MSKGAILDNGILRDARLLRSATIPSHYLEQHQRRTALVTIIVPLLGTATTIAVLPITGISAVDIGLLVGLYLATTVGLTVGFHRYFTHRSFTAPPLVRAVLAILGSMAAQGPVIFWVAAHRRHHIFSDRSGDSHSPQLHGAGIGGRLRGLWHAHVGWMVNIEVTNSSLFAKDLLRDALVVRLSKYYLVWVLLGLALPAAIGGIITETWMGALSGFLWGGLVRIFLVHHVTWGLNSFAHVYGRRAFQNNDHSRNIAWLAILTLGEGWHNNHHAFPRSAKFGLRWWQVDMGYWVISLLKAVKLCREVETPDAGMIAAKTVS